MHNINLTKYFTDEQSMQLWAANLAKYVISGLSFGLTGEIGLGKTTFCRALIQELGVSEIINSPTFAWMETYATTHGLLHHVDLYRLEEPEQYYSLNLEEYVGKDIILVEWPEKSQKVLSWLDLHGKLDFLDSGRVFKLQAKSSFGEKILVEIQDT